MKNQKKFYTTILTLGLLVGCAQTQAQLDPVTKERATAAFGLKECKLVKPVRLKDDLLKRQVYSDVKTDVQPRFSDPKGYNPQFDKLELILLDSKYGWKSIGMLGVRLEVDRGEKLGESEGFADNYEGNIDQRTSESVVGDATTYYSRSSTMRVVKGKGELNATTEAWVQIQNDAIVAVALSIPVSITTEASPGVYVNAFTGEHQKICVTDIR